MEKVNTILNFLLSSSLAICIFTNNVEAQTYGWSSLGSGANGSIYAITIYNNKVIIGGNFSQIGGIFANNVAQWDGSNWSALGNGLDNTVYALDTLKGRLYAGGSFSHSGSAPMNHLATWDGVNWWQVGNYSAGFGIPGKVRALTNYHGLLVIGGKFFIAGYSTNAHNIVKWTGNEWQTLPDNSYYNGLDDTVFALTVYNYNMNSTLIAGGKFSHTWGDNFSVSHIASWNELNWNNLSTGMNDNVYALTEWNNQLYAGGNFTIAGGISANYIAYWNGYGWTPLDQQVDNTVFTLSSLNGQLIAGGAFQFAGDVYASRIASSNGLTWSRMITGMNNTVNVVLPIDSGLLAGGNFTTAGGDWINHISLWGNLVTQTISGQVRYADSLNFVNYGLVEAVRLDVSTKELIVVDSIHVVPNDSGRYMLLHVPGGDSLFIIIIPSDEYQDNFVPTYHSSTIDWLTAKKVFPNTNLTNINVNVFRILQTEPSYMLNYNISGYVYLNFFPPNGFSQGYPYWSGSIVYAKQGNTFKGFGVTDNYEHYIIPNMPTGNYDLFAYRIGYNSGYKSIQLGSSNYDTANFYLDTFNLIGIRKINNNFPDHFSLDQNYPNPFNPVTIIKFEVPKDGANLIPVRLSVYNILGQEVAVLINDKLSPGSYKVVFNADGKNSSGSFSHEELASGVYFYRLQAGSFYETKKMILIK